MYRLAVGIVHDRGLAEDVVQEVLFKAWKVRIDRTGGVPVPWLRVVTRNAAIDLLRARRFVEVRDVVPDSERPADLVERIVEDQHYLAAVWDQIGRLDVDARTMLLLRESEDMSYDEIAEMFQTTASAVKAKLYRARHVLRAGLKDWTD